MVAVGYSGDGQLNVGWSAIFDQVAAGDGHTVGLKTDGTVVAVGDNWTGQCSTYDWDLIPDHTLTIGKSGNGSGTVSASGITCGADCTEVFPYGIRYPYRLPQYRFNLHLMDRLRCRQWQYLYRQHN